MQQIGFWTLAVVWLMGVVIAFNYAMARKVISYHTQVLGGDAATLPERLRAFYFAIVNTLGFVELAYFLVSGYVLFVPIRLGDPIAMAVFFAGQLIFALGGGIAARRLHLATGANTPWRFVAVVGFIGVVATVLWFAGRFSVAQ